MKLTMPLLALARRDPARRVAGDLHGRADEVRDQVPAGRDHRGQRPAGPVLQDAAGAERALSTTGATCCSRTPTSTAWSPRRRRRSRSTSSCSGASSTSSSTTSRAGQRGPARAPPGADGAHQPGRGVQQATMHEAISTGRERIMTETRQKADQDARNIGVEVVDVRLRRAGAARRRHRPGLRADGIGAPARGQRAALARRRRVGEDPRRCRPPAPGDPRRRLRQAQKIKGEGDAKASAIYAAAYGQNPEFYAFYRSLEAYKATFRGRNDVMVLDPRGEFFQYFEAVGRRAARRSARAGEVDAAGRRLR